jgi:predicted permease
MFNTTGFNQIMILFLIMCVGIYEIRKSILNKEINKEINKGLTQILLRITLPFMIITSFNYTYSKEMSLNMKKHSYTHYLYIS